MTRGLDELVPRRDLYAEAMAGWSSVGGAMGRAEVGARLGSAGVFAFGQWEQRNGASAGVGARITW